jgi:NAD-dependent SIR2 family protein deacetylase
MLWEESLGTLRKSPEAARIVALRGAGISAEMSGARVAFVNPDPTPADEFAEWILRGPAGVILARLI